MKTFKVMIALLALHLAMLIPPAGSQTPLYFGWGAATPGAADYDGDRFQELGLYDANDGAIYVRKLGGDELAFGLAMTVSGFAAAVADFDGDGLSDLGSYDRDTGAWYAWCSRTGYQLGSIQCAAGTTNTTPQPADFDGDGKADPALYDSASGIWVIYPSASGYQPVAFYHLAGSACQAVPADYDGDGKADPAVYDEASGLWAANLSGSGYALNMLVYGGPGCAPSPADFDGDGKADPTIYCAALGVWGTLNSSSNYAQNLVIQGGPDCTPIPGNYYFTNRADYALYNTTNGSWHIAYQSPATGSGAWRNLACDVLPSLLIGDWKGATKGGIGWILKLIFDHGQEPEDPHWGEMREMLSAMNGKLDQLLVLSKEIYTQLNNLCWQMQYDSAKTRILISGLLAENAFSTITSLYDSESPEGYKYFYACDTNHPPSDAAVAEFVNIVRQRDLPACILAIKATILPPLETREGILRQWVDMAKLKGVTPDNLPDHYQAFFAYFSTLYSYQVKAAELYVAALRQTYTNEAENAATYNWITNNFMATIRDEVAEFRARSYDLVLAAADAGYDPASATNQPANVTNVAATLNNLEFFARQWLAQTQTLSATFLTMDRPDILGKYTNFFVFNRAGGLGPYPAISVATNYAYSRPYGFKNPDTKNIGVSDRYVFLRADFGRQAPYRYAVNVGHETNTPLDCFYGDLKVRNYDNNMNPTNGWDTPVTNWFGHGFFSPWNCEPLALPLNAPDWWNNRQENCTYVGGQPGDTGISYDIQERSTINGISMKMELVYELSYFSKLPEYFGVQPWTFALGYPFAVSNSLSRTLNVRAHLVTDHLSTYISCQRWDSGSAGSYQYGKEHHDQEWQFGGGGFISFANAATTQWKENPRKMTHPAGSGTRTGFEKRWPIHNEMVACAVPPSQNGPLLLYVGGEMNLRQNCYRTWTMRDPIPVWSAPIHAWGWVTFNAQRIAISFR